MAAIPYSSQSLNSNWTFKQGDRSSTSEYLSANDVPTEIHRDLIKNGKIEDPFNDLNELSVRWVADVPWTYRATFLAPPDHGKAGTKTVLKFEGLDTFASAYLNGKLVLESDNMFIEHRADVSESLNQGEDNVLEIVFESARQRGLELVKKHKEHRFIVHQTEISRGPVRKAQYHWGWDWGPLLLTCGPWKPISIETYAACIDHVWVEYELSDDLQGAKGTVYVNVQGGAGAVDLEISRENETVKRLTLSSATTTSEGDKVSSFEFELSSIALWWPRGYGRQSLYTVTVTLRAAEKEEKEKYESAQPIALDQTSKTFGFRKVELIQEPDAHGTSFYFRINNVDIFCGGSCWIPADSFLSRLTPSDYRSWLDRAAEGNQTMVRVWGGGIYEDSSFYAAADELGILIWQDFAFACANYPAYPSYLKSVETEARQNVRRLRNHPSLVIWAGNNEDYQIVERYGLEYCYEKDKDPQSWLKTNFPARYIYEHLLPNIISEETKGVPYHPSSPFGNGTSTVLKVDPTVGDIHQWNVWHGTMQPYQHLPSMGGRFVSEFGMEAYPHLSTLEKCITREEDRYPGSMAMDFRNKAVGHERRLISYVAENFRIRYDLPSFTHLTQVMQADALSWAYKSWRRDWGSRGNRKCGGVLVWQFNDCWPTMSWAVVDYYGVPKPAYYAIKRALEPTVVGVRRKVNEWTMRPADELWQRDTGHIDMRKIWEDVEFDVWAASSRTERLTGELVVKFISIKSGNEVLPALREKVEIEPNGTTDVIKAHKVQLPSPQDPNNPFSTLAADPFVIYATLLISDNQIAWDVSWPEPIKYLRFPDREVEVLYANDKTQAFVSAGKPVKGFVFDEREGITLSDNGFDLVPGETKKVSVKGCGADELGWKYVEMD
ncbi:glycoside hydrolase family 2 protein [Trematosphaeria pertusa]|uniref:Beta-mannosidase B n=1 Tax=Trematosphaeria pertusa TaxID=390896 RepID=A0A6A6IJ80_9PLEO|nr:glycoside hydrolase family 2 protein [Trematosphaeria pertusa]KAF2250279.1 glycoside hydrolase family 2 protein [Trematosphaeria pertusa]